MTKPGIDGATPLIEGHRLPGLVAERRHRHRPQAVLFDGVADALQVNVFGEQAAQGRTVQ